MAVKRITIQDVADACGLSRNTVSKIFNLRGAVPEATRRAVLAKAQEMGYGRIPDAAPTEDGGRHVALLTRPKKMNHNFGAYFISSFTDQICRSGYTMKLYEVSDAEIANRRLPPHLSLEDTAGILCIELFDRAYQKMICSLGLPCTFVDGFPNARRELLYCDFVTMENFAAVRVLTQRMIRAGAKRVGFVGDRDHCNSFSERWDGFVSALDDASIPLDPSCCILEPDGVWHGDTDWLLSRLAAMPELPDAFVCANDYLAIHLMTALKKRGLRIPEDVMVSGFDGSPEAAVVEPSLTTAQIASTDIGRFSARILIDRIQNPDRPYRWISLQSAPVWGGSTGD